MKVGDYCRTDKGKIGKIVHFEPRDKYPYSYDRVILDTEGYKRTTRNIIKCSPNIINLIQIGDYVNGMQVTRICFDENGERILNLSNCILELMNEDIKSILTKECFESMEYKVKE